MRTIHKSAKLANVLYDIRGPIMDAARQMEDEGQKIIKLLGRIHYQHLGSGPPLDLMRKASNGLAVIDQGRSFISKGFDHS